MIVTRLTLEDRVTAMEEAEDRQYFQSLQQNKINNLKFILIPEGGFNFLHHAAQNSL